MLFSKSMSASWYSFVMFTASVLSAAIYSALIFIDTVSSALTNASVNKFDWISFADIYSAQILFFNSRSAS